MAFDNSLCAQYGNSLSNLIAKLLQTVSKGNEAFKKSTCLRIVLTFIDANCKNPNDPYEQFRYLEARSLIERLALFWFNKRKGVPRDSAIFASGFSDGTKSLGIAAVSGACSRFLGISWVEGLRPKVFAHEVAHLIGAKHTTSGLMQPRLSETTPLWFSKTSVTEMRKFLEQDGRSWCINKNRLFCGKKKCFGKCEKGVCIISSVNKKSPARTPTASVPPSGSGGTCARTFKPATPPACLSSRNLDFISFNSGAVVAPSFRIAYGKVRIQFRVLFGSVSLSVGMRIGSVPTRTFKPQANGDTGVYERELRTFDAPGGNGACCWKKVFVKAILQSCGFGSCQQITATYSTTLRCPRICLGKGTPLGMTAFRQCPSCA